MLRTLVGIITFAALLLAIPPCEAYANWGTDLRHQEIEALRQLKPLVVDFVVHGPVSSALEGKLTAELGTHALYARVGPDDANANSDRQAAFERHFNVTAFPTILVLRPFMIRKDFESGGFYEFREVDRCVVSQNYRCGSIVTTILSKRSSGYRASR